MSNIIKLTISKGMYDKNVSDILYQTIWVFGEFWSAEIYVDHIILKIWVDSFLERF
jgi:hypothetical protein